MPALRIPLLILCGLLVAGCADGVPDSKPENRSAAAAGQQSKGFLAGLRNPPPASERRAAPSAQSRPRMPMPLSRAALAGGDVVVAGPDGYCIDPTTIQSRAERGFAMIASCSILSSGRAGTYVEPMIATVTVGPRGGAEDIPGPAGLAEMAGAPLLGGETSSGFVVANLGSGGDALLQGGDTRYWRGAFLQGDRLVGLALYAPKGSALAGDGGAAMLGRIKTRIATLSPGSAVAAVPQAPVAAPRPTSGGFLGRLLGGRDLP